MKSTLQSASSNFLGFILLFFLLHQDQQDQMSYLGQDKPGMKPEIFAPGFISMPDQYEYGSVFTKDAKTFYFGVALKGRAEIRMTSLKNNEWTTPKPILSHDIYSYNDPFLSPTEDRLYFISDRPIKTKGKKKDYDIWYVEKTGEAWSKPINAGPLINTVNEEYYISFTEDGSLYFGTNAYTENARDFDIYAAASTAGEFQKPERLSKAINTQAYEADVFIAPDSSYMIFCATRRNGLGQGDLYISFKQTDGTWSPSKNMGDLINSPGHELCPFVSRDGKYFFFTSKKDVYWVDAAILEQYRPSKD